MREKTLVAASLLILIVAGCSNNEASNEPEKETNLSQEQAFEIKQNEELTKQVKDEEGVLDGQVYKQDDMVIGTLILEETVSDENAKKLAEKYVKELKAQYKDETVNVQAVRDGENVANITED